MYSQAKEDARIRWWMFGTSGDHRRCPKCGSGWTKFTKTYRLKCEKCDWEMETVTSRIAESN